MPTGFAELRSKQHPGHLHEGSRERRGRVGSWAARSSLSSSLEEHPVGFWAVRKVREASAAWNATRISQLEANYFFLQCLAGAGVRNPILAFTNLCFVPCKHSGIRSSPYLMKLWNRPGAVDKIWSFTLWNDSFISFITRMHFFRGAEVEELRKGSLEAVSSLYPALRNLQSVRELESVKELFSRWLRQKHTTESVTHGTPPLDLFMFKLFFFFFTSDPSQTSSWEKFTASGGTTLSSSLTVTLL